MFIDQLKNAYLQVHSSRLGPDMTFNIWWIQFYFENIGKIISIKGESNKDIIHKDISKYLGLRMFYNCIILFTANRRLPEFTGHEALTYPGTPSPRKMKIEPRHCISHSSFVLDWKKIRLKKREKLTDHLLVNSTTNIRIVVSSPFPET